MNAVHVRQSSAGNDLGHYLAGADVAALLMYATAATGDTTLLREEWRPRRSADIRTDAGLSPEHQWEIRAHCLRRIATPEHAGQLSATRPAPEVLRAILRWFLGDAGENGESPDAYLPMVHELLADDGRAPTWRPDVSRDFRVGVVGAGMTGLLVAHRLRQAGVSVVVYEKSDDVGGTWRDNHYPGCRVDVPSHLYSYSFESTDWRDYFSTQPTMQTYLGDFAERHGLYDHVRFATEVRAAEWCEEAAHWRVRVRESAGERDERVEVLVSAVGQLNRPSVPAIPGRETFRGPSFHSARWDHSVDLQGARVAVIGTGASALQFIPEVARVARSVDVFQRTPAWLLPTPHLRSPVDERLRWSLRNLPGYDRWYRVRLFLPRILGQLAEATVDPEYGPTERAVSAASDEIRRALTRNLHEQVDGAPWLAPHVVPRYPVGAKRPIRDDGTWLRTLKQDHVTLVTDPLTEIRHDAVVTSTGARGADVVIYGTGFRASDFLTPMTVTGRGGADLHAQWDGTARAYLGMAVPGHPNLFLMYGPNTNVVVHSNLVFFFECQAAYVVDAVRFLLAEGRRAVAVRPDRAAEYDREIDTASALRAWGWSGVNTWYRNAHGRSTNNWPLSTFEYWRRTHGFDPEDYTVT